MKLRTVLVAAAAALGLMSGADAATEYFVSKDGGSDGYDGLAASWDGTHGPKQTIQAAVDKAAADDTVTVLPGVYDQGATYNSTAGATSNRVAITKAITLRSRDGAETTVIRGAPDFAGEPNHGLGPAAVRCVYIANVAAVVRGFTLNGGYVNQGTGEDGNGVRAGGVLCAGHSPIIVDCVISDNVATRGGGAFEGQYVRTVFTGNRVYSTAANKTTNGTVCRTCSLFGCLIVGNGASDCTGTLCAWLKEAVNCTFANNYSLGAIQVQNGTSYTGGSTIKNCYADGAEIWTQEGYSTADHCVTGWGELAAPVLGDCRPLTGGVLPGAGDPDALALYPEGYADVDILGNARTTAGKVAIGAIEASVTPQGGKVVLVSSSRDATVDGAKVAQPSNYFHAVEWPKQVYLRPAALSDASKGFFCHYATNTVGGVRYPLFNDREGGLWLTMPGPGETLSLTPQTGTVKYVRVDAADGGDGSEKNPYNTLSAAADAATGGGNSYYVIKVGPGTYRTGGGNFTNGTTDWGNARVTLDKSNILLTSTDGAEDTVIEGAEATGGGCGEDAYRCVFLANTNYRLAISGFTLRNGYSRVGSGGSDTTGQGGAFRSPKQASSEAVAFHQVLDSVIEDCSATRGPGGYGGWMVRCLIRNCIDAGGNATTRENVLSSCVLYDNTAAHVIIGQNVKAYHCTGVGLSGKVNYYNGTGNQLLSNCLFLDGNCSAASEVPITGTFAETTGTHGESRITYGTACVADKANRDLRLLATSPLIGGGDVSADGWTKYATSDIANNPLAFVNGKPTVGAYQRPATAVVVEPGPYVTCAEAGTHVVEPGESVTVTMSSDARRFLGIRVDGVFHPGVTTWTVSPAAGTLVAVEGVTATDWYVDANAGNDKNDGFTPETAKRTLVGAMAAAVAAGDTVHAAEGVYKEGKDRPTVTKDNGTATLYSRVIVPEGVTLEADGRQAETVIEGGPASGPEEQGSANNTNLGSFQYCFDKYGMGTDAVRCALLMPGATLRGFTLRGAASGCLNSENNENCIGAVMGRDYVTCLVEDCLFTSNCVGRGSAAYVTANRCVFADNLAAWNCPVARFSELHNCLATGNCGNPLSDVCRGFYSCTFRDNWASVNRISKAARVCYQTNKQWGNWDVKLVNSLLLQDSQSGSPNVFGTVVNSILSPDCLCTVTNASVNVWTYPSAEVLDAEGRPLLDGPAADKADASWYPAEWGDRDVLGGQRVYNGALDIGAVEGDWRPAYAATLSASSRLRVTAADPSVKLSDDGTGVVIPSGKLNLTWGRGVEYPGTFNAVVTGGGVLTISRAGEVIAEVRAGDSGEFKLDNLAAGTPLEFSYAPGAAGNEGQATLSSFKISTGFAILIR